MPLFFQDRVTGDLAKYSAMRVIDRTNEQMVLAEQNLSANGNYSDNDYIRTNVRMPRLTDGEASTGLYTLAYNNN